MSNKNPVLTGLLSAAVLAQFVPTVVYYGQLYNSFADDVYTTALTFNCIAAAMDMCISCTLIWLLWKSRSGIKGTDSILKKLVAYTVGSGLVTEVMWIVAIAQVATETNISVIVDPIIPKRQSLFVCLPSLFLFADAATYQFTSTA